MVQCLQKSGMKIGMISGDREQASLAVSHALGIRSEFVIGDATPSGKVLHTKKIAPAEKIVMVGNGLNDSLVLAKSAVGVAVADASGAARESADLQLLDRDLRKLVEAYKISRGGTNALKRVFAFSICYNSATLTAALMGYISPVVAAVLMPVSSISVALLATVWRVNKQDISTKKTTGDSSRQSIDVAAAAIKV